VLTGRTRSIVTLVGLTSILTVFPSMAGAHGTAAPGPHAVASIAARAEQLTMEFVRLNMQYQLAAGDQKPRTQQSLQAAALAREQQLLGLIELDPGEVLRLAVPDAVRAALPASVQAHVEQAVTLDGTLETLHADDDIGGGEYLYHLRTTGGRLSLHFAADAPDLPTGTYVHVRGIRVQDAVALEGGSSVVPVTSVPSNTFGEQRVLVIPVYFTDKTQAVYCPELEIR